MSEETPSRGTITLDGKPLPAEPTSDRGVVFQRYSVFPHLTVLENVMLPLELADRRFYRGSSAPAAAPRVTPQEPCSNMSGCTPLLHSTRHSFPAECSNGSLWRKP